MDIIMIDTQNVIDSLQKIYKKRQLTQKKAYEIVHDFDPINCPSETTIARVFREGASAEKFRWEASLRPIANAFLGLEDIESSEDPEEQALKSILKLKKDQLGKTKTELEDEIAKYHKRLAEETAKFQKSLEFAMHQIELTMSIDGPTFVPHIEKPIWCQRNERSAKNSAPPFFRLLLAHTPMAMSTVK